MSLPMNERASMQTMEWVDGFQIRVRIEAGVPMISANREGLLSLANHLRRMAEQPGREHIHLDQYNSLEEGSAELIIEKV